MHVRHLQEEKSSFERGPEAHCNDHFIQMTVEKFQQGNTVGYKFHSLCINKVYGSIFQNQKN